VVAGETGIGNHPYRLTRRAAIVRSGVLFAEEMLYPAEQKVDFQGEVDAA
jgi:hypothetical protein